MQAEPACTCGHALEDHHTSWFAMTGQRLVEECEAEECQAKKWDEQCQHYQKGES